MKITQFHWSYLNEKLKQYWQDIVIILIVCVLGGLVYYTLAQLISAKSIKISDIWFEADLPRIFKNMTERFSNHYRVKVHPLFSLIAYPPVFLLRKIFGFEPLVSVRILISLIASLWLGTLFILLRLIGANKLEALIFSLLGGISAGAIFWFTVPETYPFGSLSILAALLLVTIIEYYQVSPWWYLGVSSLTLSFTTTNWMVGVFATFVNHRWKQALQITVNSFALVTLLWGIQKYIFPSALFFLGDQEEKKYVEIIKSPLAYWQVIQSFFSHTLIMPAIELKENLYNPDYPLMLTQSSLPGSASWWGSLGVGLWLGLLGLGLWGFFSTKKHKKLRIVLGLSLLGQLGLHLLYGEETFLYALHFLPLLIVLAAFSLLTRARLIALFLTVILLICVANNNYIQFKQANKYFSEHGSGRSRVQSEMRWRPSEPWPRGAGHVVLAIPGTREEDKAYHEPGGSFSPSVGSFGVSIWLMDNQGNLPLTSDNIPLTEINQELVHDQNQIIPGILTKTNDYQTYWFSQGLGRWQLDFEPSVNSKMKPMILIRSVGPAGGPIQALNWDGQKLLINSRWSVQLSSVSQGVSLGEEGKGDWLKEKSSLTEWQAENGWGYARFELNQGEKYSLIIEDSSKQTQPELTGAQIQHTLKLDIPDQQFVKSLNAQIDHLMMGLVGKQTRPGEPTNYPLPWQRDGVYTLVALARAGQLETAKELSTYFAEKDFFGGFGPEADAPGLGIWALEEVAVRLNDPQYDQWLWPHVRRKAEFILKMLSTKESIYQPVTAPILSKMEKDPELNLVAEPAKNGLIIGKMDHHRPLLFINAVSYRGLLDAANLADRVNQPEKGQLWRNEAKKLQKAWINAFKPPQSNNERTYISSLWQSWIATSHQDALLQSLEKRWTKRRDDQGNFRQTPLWTYFDLAETHQWLFLRQPERVWTTLQWFWNHQASPGLYTWWEGQGEENSSGRWEEIRGWVNPPHVTPHYWTASEMLLLQLDMLAYIDHSSSEPTLVIGGGVPMKWLDNSITVKNLSLGKTQVDWSWDGKKMNVEMRGNRMKVKLGSAFPANTPLNVLISEDIS